jgi:hypothetical protein
VLVLLVTAASTLFFLLQKQLDPLTYRLAAGDIVFLTICPQTLLGSHIQSDAVVDTFGIFRFWSACARAQIITYFQTRINCKL